MTTFAERLSVAERINARIGALLASRYADERRLVLMLAYLNLSLSHHQGIICLMVNRLYGPALVSPGPYHIGSDDWSALDCEMRLRRTGRRCGRAR